MDQTYLSIRIVLGFLQYSNIFINKKCTRLPVVQYNIYKQEVYSASCSTVIYLQTISVLGFLQYSIILVN